MKISNFFKKREKENKNSKIAFTKNAKGFYDLLHNDGYTELSKIPEFNSCVDKIADLTSNMSIHLMKNTKNGDVRIKNELSRKVDINPCKFMTKKSWLYFIVQDLIKNGNAIVFPKYNQKGYIEDLIPINSKSVYFDWDYENQDYFIVYKFTKYYSDEFIHFVLNPDGTEFFKGRGYKLDLSNINENLSLATKTRKSFLKGNYMPSLIIKVDSTEELLETEEGKESIENKYLTRKESGKPWIIPAEMLEVNQVKPLTLNDLALNDSVVIDKKTVASMMSVPSFLLGVGEFKKQEFNNFINTKIMSIGKIIEQTLTKYLIYSPDYYFRCNPRSLYSYDLNEIASMGIALRNGGLILGNEVRDWLGMTPLDGLDELIILENFIPSSKIGDQKKLKEGGE